MFSPYIIVRKINCIVGRIINKIKQVTPRPRATLHPHKSCDTLLWGFHFFRVNIQCRRGTWKSLFHFPWIRKKNPTYTSTERIFSEMLKNTVEKINQPERRKGSQKNSYLELIQWSFCHTKARIGGLICLAFGNQSELILELEEWS